ncbi:alpha/beta hydrolase [Aridibaculum aurantiacum]|uniref:alpha/beta hydrolase n=1 Tax=Aridibaculum aurantiacum TaxID=2810307 RepID=UPI001A973655|nr:alpha/beta hydrolase [Aridibaculum aurantiacum]
MKKVYFISGLGADKRAFNFLDLRFCEPVFITWLQPLPNETLQSYALRIFEACIKDEHATIIGLSLGGMLATEIAKAHPSTNVIIIASCKTFREIPAYLRFWRHLPVYKLTSRHSIHISGRIVLRILGARGKEQQQLQRQILKDSNPAFTRWALDAVVKWRNETVPSNLVHIHGTADKLLPYSYVKADHTIIDGEHVMVMDRANELSALLEQLVTKNA